MVFSSPLAQQLASAKAIDFFSSNSYFTHLSGEHFLPLPPPFLPLPGVDAPCISTSPAARPIRRRASGRFPGFGSSSSSSTRLVRTARAAAAASEDQLELDRSRGAGGGRAGAAAGVLGGGTGFRSCRRFWLLRTSGHILG